MRVWIYKSSRCADLVPATQSPPSRHSFHLLIAWAAVNFWFAYGHSFGATSKERNMWGNCGNKHYIVTHLIISMVFTPFVNVISFWLIL